MPCWTVVVVGAVAASAAAEVPSAASTTVNATTEILVSFWCTLMRVPSFPSDGNGGEKTPTSLARDRAAGLSAAARRLTAPARFRRRRNYGRRAAAYRRCSG